MKFFIVSLLIVACAAQALSLALQGQLNEQQGLNENLESLRIRKSAKSAYGPPAAAPSYAPPPCPKNYLLSCGPQLQPVPCSQGSGYQGAYSENIPQYMVPRYLAPPQQYIFPQYAVPTVTEV